MQTRPIKKSLSLRSGMRRSEIRCLLAISGTQLPSRGAESQLQVVVGSDSPYQRYLDCNGLSANPEHVYGEILDQFCRAMQVPGYIAKVNYDEITSSANLVSLTELCMKMSTDTDLRADPHMPKNMR